MLLLTIQSSTSIFSDSAPSGRWNTPIPLLYWCVDFAPWELPLLDFLLLLFSVSCWQNLQTAMYILNRQGTLLPAGKLRHSRLTHPVDHVLRGKAVCVQQAEGEKSWTIFKWPTHSPLPHVFFTFSKSEREHKAYDSICKNFFLIPTDLVWNNFCSQVRLEKTIEYKFEILLSCIPLYHSFSK